MLENSFQRNSLVAALFFLFYPNFEAYFILLLL